jgi:hypothetical protein
VPVQVPVLQFDPGAGRRLGVEPHLDLAGASLVGLDRPPRADVPAEHHPVGRVEGQDPRPPALAAVRGSVHDVAADPRLDAERDQAAEVLRSALAEGRLTRPELDERIAVAFAANTRAGLRELTSDLPGALSPPSAGLPVADPDPGGGTGTHPDLCLLLRLLFAFPPAGIVYWILTARRPPQPSARTLAG